MLSVLKRLNKKQIIFILISVIFIVFQVWLDLKLPDYMTDMTILIKTPGSAVIDLLIPGSKMLLCALGSFLAAIITGYFSAHVAASFSQKLRKDLFYKIEDFGMEEMKKFSTSSLIVRTTNDVLNLQRFLAMGMQVIIKAPILACWAVSKIYSKNLDWSIITGSFVFILLIIVTIVLILTIPKTNIIQKLIDDLNRITRENITGIRVIKAFNAQEYQNAKFEKCNEEVTKTNLFIAKVMAILYPSILLIMSLLTLSIYYTGAQMIDKALMDAKIILFSNMIVFSAYAVQVIMGFMMLVMIFIIYPRARVSAIRIKEILNTNIAIHNGNYQTKDRGQGEIEFKNVSFKYPDAEEYILKNISFHAQEGETVAFIGGTASGKSTLVNLIPRLYDVTEGEILINNINIKNYDMEYLNQKISYIPQKAVIFEGTIQSNVTYGSKDISNKKIDEAITVAQAKDFIMQMEDGLNNKVASKGTNLSGGQKQRIAIARAIARNPEIYIFDDSFSALDYKTDFQLRQNLKKYAKNVTTLIVAQRIGTIMHADKIIVLNHGEIVGIGTHQELLKKSKIYLEIVESQLSAKELANE